MQQSVASLISEKLAPATAYISAIVHARQHGDIAAAASTTSYNVTRINAPRIISQHGGVACDVPWLA